MPSATNGDGEQNPKLSAPFRVGIWCNYEFDIRPDKGIGILVYNLVQGFLALQESVEVVLFVKAGDQERVASLTGRHSRLRIVSRPSGQLPRKSGLGGFLELLVGWMDRIRAKVSSLRRWLKRHRYFFAVIKILTFPARILARGLRGLNRQLAPIEPFWAEVTRQHACDAWIVPHGFVDHPLPFPSVLLIHDFGNDNCQDGFERGNDYHESASRLIRLRVREATFCAGLSPLMPDTGLLGSIAPSKVRMIPSAASAEWLDVARDLLQVCKEAAPGFLPRRPEVFLFLQIPYQSGVWEATKDLLRSLVEINRQRQQLTLTVGVDEHQTDTFALEQLGPDLGLERFRLQNLPPDGAAWLLGKCQKELPEDSQTSFSFMKGCAGAAFRADAWLALVDRFEAPLLPVRPYGVIVYDMIQRHVRESFDRPFFIYAAKGMRPTLENAQMVVVTSPATREEVLAEYDLDPGRIRLVPVACEPRQRFARLTGEPVRLPREPFILNVGNAGPHKGGSTLLRGYARLKKRWGKDTPLLVMCGWMTHTLSARYQGATDHSKFRKIRRLVKKLGLQEERDVMFLGFVRDSQLLDLYQRCALVVSAAKYDNGSFSLIEANYFGRPVVSSQYPASKYLCERFGIDAEFFPVDDDRALAEAIIRALAKKPSADRELETIRLRLANPELGLRRYAERIYECLIELAQIGRRQRTGSTAVKTAA